MFAAERSFACIYTGLFTVMYYYSPALGDSMKQKRILAVHDISCFGKCSLTVALPIISSTGVECAAMPTAVLSTHTGGFTGYTYRDLTDDMIPILEHWKTLDLRFDSIYTGFLGSFEQISIVSRIFDELKGKDTVIVVDPVMADNGELYPIFGKDFPKEMRKLCEKADVLIPNITEAALLLEEEYIKGPYSRE
jgi:pyridoxine kinase